MSSNRSKLLVDIVHSKNATLRVCEAQDLINYFDEAHNEDEECTNVISPNIKHQPVEPLCNETRDIEANQALGNEEQLITSNLLSQSDLNYIINTVGDISDNEVEIDFGDDNIISNTTVTCHSETSHSQLANSNDEILNNNEPSPKSCHENMSLCSISSTPDPCDITPIPSPYMPLGDIDYDNSSCGATSPILTDTTVMSSTLASSEMSDASTPRARKRKRYVKKAITKTRHTNKSDWLDIKRKLLVNLGEAHMSRSGKQQMAKEIKAPCKSNCRLKCSEKFCMALRKKIFEKFWNLGDHNRQWSLKQSKMDSGFQAKKQWTRDSKRLNVFKFFLPPMSNDSGNKIMVCKTMFKNTLSVSNTFIQSAIDKYDKDMGVCSKDMRGFHQNHPTIINSRTKDIVIQHVKSFAPVESHRIREDSNKLYMDSELTFKKMFKMYLSWCNEQGITENTVTSVRQYKDIINNELNIAFHKPKKDQCDICHSMKNNTSPSNDDILKRTMHDKNKKIARKLKNTDKIEAQSDRHKVCTAMFDFQKILTTPHGEISVLYYKRKFSVYNFTVFDAGLNEATCYMWDETVAKRGSNEVASCLFSFIKNRVEAGIKDFRFWSDNCAGQNRNRIVFFMYLYVSKTFMIDVCHRFLEVGHTQNEADSVHALIERTAKNKLIYIPDEWYTLVRWAKQNHPPYKVIEVDQDLVMDFKSWLHTKQWLKDANLEKMSWGNIREIKIKANQPDTIEFKYDLDEPCRILNCNIDLRNTRGRKKKEEIFMLKKTYNEPILITEAKYKDLTNLCDTMIIPGKYHDFYKNLKHGSVANNEED